MKNIFTPLWISISIFIGLSTFYISSMLLIECLLDVPYEAKVLEKHEESYPSGVKIIYSIPTTIDTILYNNPLLQESGDGEGSLGKINQNAFLNLQPAVFKWLVFHVIALSLCMASSLFIIYLVLQIWSPWKEIWRVKYLLSVLLIVVPIIIILIIKGTKFGRLWDGIRIMEHFHLIFKDPEAAVHLVLRPMQYVSFVPFIGFLLINLRTYHVFQANKGVPTLEEFVRLKYTLNIFAFYLGLLVSCAVVGTRLQQEMIIAQNPNFRVLYTQEMIYAYGIGFSFILALIFVPSYAYLQSVGSKYAKETETEPTKSKSSDWWALSKETVDNLKLTFSILLPLLTSIVQPFLG